VSTLDDLRALPANWDGYGGITITEAALNTADKLTFVPCATGGIQIELHAGGMTVEVEIGPDGLIGSVYAERRKGSS
jgi:hypothetical protein